MTPAARIAAAADLLDEVIQGAPAEKTLTNWARSNRYAGSKDRAAVRDHVYDALRCLHSFAHLGGAMTGRGVMIGALRAKGIAPEELFTGEGYAPAALSDAEHAFKAADPDELIELDCPPWLAPQLRAALGVQFAPVMRAMRRRAQIFLRVNTQKATLEQAVEVLAGEEIETCQHSLSPTALEVTQNPRRVRNSKAYKDGLVELQDAGSQAIVDKIDLQNDLRVLDYCAGGGGKALALAGRGLKKIFAHDKNADRMRDLPERAKRAGVDVEILQAEALKDAAPFDLIVADVPCSGSGTWRRAPDEKWRLNAEKLDELCAIQAGILDKITDLAGRNGAIAYITCSLLERENDAQIDAFLNRHPGWALKAKTILTPLDGADGFFLALLKRE